MPHQALPTWHAPHALRPLVALLRRTETRTPMGGRIIALGRPAAPWLPLLAVAVIVAPLLVVGAAALA